MTFRNKHFCINVALCTALFVLGGCTGETDIDRTAGNGNLPSDGTRLTVRATASGFQLPAPEGSGAPVTRTPVMEGTSTIFQTGDAIGLFCVRRNASGDEYISADIRNLKMTYIAGAGGTTGTWQSPATDPTPLVYTDAVTYFAYYPYMEELTTASVNNEQTIREWLKTYKPLATDMPTLATLAANDLMTATALPSQDPADRGTLALSFKHEYALLVVKPMGKGVCVPPAGVTAYSYRAGAKSNDWGIDKNLVKTGANDFKMKINGRKACEMSDGTYRILTQVTTSSSQISCDYATDNGGTQAVTASGFSVSSGFKANTCYTLKVHATAALGEVERAVQPGDFVYQHNGKIEIYPGDGEVDVDGKIPDYTNAVGIVVTTDPTRMTDAACNAKGWNHAYVMAVKNIPGDQILWMKNSSFSIPYPPVAHMSTAETYMNGYAETEMMLAQTPLSDFPIFEALKQYQDNNAIPAGINRSPWFIPSIGQWFDVLINLCGKSPHDFATKEIAAAGSWGAWMSSRDQKNEMLAKANGYLTKVGATFLMLSSSSDIIGFWLTSHFTGGRIWVFFGIDATGVFSIEYMPGADISSYNVDIAVARPFFAF